MAEKVGELYYDITLDTAKMIDGQRKVDKEIGKTTGTLDRFDGKLTETAQAVKIHTVALEATASASRRAAVASTDLAGASNKVATAQKKAADQGAKTAQSLDKNAISAKQLVAATRGVPAQFTDIATSLAAGQNPLQVLLQQGGQLKDMFGGIGPAARALGGYLLGLINPLTVGAAALGTFLAGFVKGRQEVEEMSRTLELSGNRAGVTVDQLNSLAAAMDNMAGVTRGKAAEALTVLAAVGVSGEENLGRFAAAAIRLEQVGGPAVAETAKAFKDLQASPLQAALRLNDTVNFLTVSLYRQIKALEEQGKTVEAARVAQNAYADAIEKRTPKIEANLGSLERAWRAIANAAREGWDAILNIGRAETPEQKIEGVRKKIAALQQQLASGGFSTTAGGAAIGRGLGPQARAQKQAELAALQEQVRMYELAKSSAEGLAKADADRAKEVKELADRDKKGEHGTVSAAVKFDSAGYLADLRKAQETEMGVINETEAEKLRVAKANLDAKKINEAQYQEAVTLITAAAEQDRVKLREKAQKEIDDDRKRSDAEVKQALEERKRKEKEAIDYVANLTRAVNPIDALRQEYQAKLDLVTQYEQLMAQAGVDATEQGQITRTQITNEYELQRRALAEQSFRSQSDANAFLMDSINSLSSTATSSIMGLIEGTATATDVMRSLAGTVLNEAVSALVQMGVQQIKNALIGDTIAAADKAKKAAMGAVYAASVSAQVAGMTSLAAMNAFAATAAIPIIGPALAPAAAAAAGAAAAALGAPAIATAPIAGARLYGGPADAGNLYRVNEAGRPEMFTGRNGAQYMLPTKSGQVTPADQVAGGAVQWTINVNNSAPGAAATASVDQQTRTVTIAVAEVANQISSNSGPVWNAMRGATNVRGKL